MNEQLNCPSSPNLSLAIGLNNEGAQLIRRGCYDDAVSTLLDAVHHFREGQELLLSDMQLFPCMLQRRHGPSCRLASNKTTTTTTTTTAAQHELPTRELLRTDDYIYREPVVLEDIDGSAIVEPRMVQLSIIFNFALSRHLKALSGIPSRQEKRLRTALKLYNWALSLERTYKDDESSLGLLPCLGIINNTAQIHRQLHKNEKADKMFGILLTSLMLVKTRGDDVQVEQLAGFYSATSYLILKRSHVARAA